MDYKLKFEDFLDKMQGLLDEARRQGHIIVRVEDLENAFPELKESEDERIRQLLIRFVAYDMSDNYSDDFTPADCVAWLEKQGEPQDKGEISDGYHTFNELYYYRMLYNAAFFNMLPKEWVHKSKRHNDGEECFGGGWFIVMANLPTGQISNHYELKDWDLFQIPEKEVADKWDGHTPQEAADRLHKYLLEKQGEQEPAKTVKWSPQEESCICQLESLVKEQWRQAECVHNSVNIKKMQDLMFFLKTLNPNKKSQRMISAEAKEAMYDKPAWSEDDEKMLVDAYVMLDWYKGNNWWTARRIKNWLNSLKERIGG